MKTFAERIVAAVAAAALLGIGALAGYRAALRSQAPAAADPASAAGTAGRRVLYWHDPMVPGRHFDKPGRSPFMDMELVPKYADGAAAGGVRIDASVQQSVGLRTATVETGRIAAAVRVPGTLSWDLRRESVVVARAEGLVTQLALKTPYSRVRKGQALATLRVPAWSSALAEARALHDADSPAARALREAADRRLRALGVPRGGANDDGSVILRADADGIVTEITVREGQTVMPGTPLFRINGTETVWLDAAVPQSAVAHVRAGTPAQAIVAALPGRRFAGDVDALLPQVDPATRTQRARIVLRNPGGELAAGQFAEASLQPDADTPRPLVPSEALLATGSDGRVIVRDDDGRFRPLAVQTGRSGGGRTEILAGLRGGERVVVSGQFLIDSEANLSGALARLGEPDEMDAPRRCPVLYWYDPTVPAQHFDAPGGSPFMDSALVPKFAPEADADCTVDDAAPRGAQP
ncbi:efflux RND transporter periplasmic adaptor subunit [Tahibacter sp.]|uniref:efflux RND transporter periplasmic adaptor subunit n=1 Tax=Tahibacter sp. TaxID=2056211 RepID=UPI0031F304D8